MKRKYSKVPSSVAAGMIGPGYTSASILNHTLLHIVPTEPYARPLCGRTGQLWDRTVDPEKYYLWDVCAPCAQIREKIRRAKTSVRIIHDEQKLGIAAVGDRVGFEFTGAEVALCKWIAYVHKWDPDAGEIVVSIHGIAKPHFRLRYDPKEAERFNADDLGCFDGLAEIIEITPADKVSAEITSLVK